MPRITHPWIVVAGQIRRILDDGVTEGGGLAPWAREELIDLLTLTPAEPSWEPPKAGERWGCKAASAQVLDWTVRGMFVALGDGPNPQCITVPAWVVRAQWHRVEEAKL